MVLLGDLVDITGGGTPSRKIAEYWNGEIPWATVKDFKSVELTTALESITEEGLNRSASNLIPAGSIIVPTRMAVGKAAINTIDMAINQDLKALIIKDKKEVDCDYLFRSILNKSRYLERRGKGATVKGITLDVLREMEISLPPLKEQKRIAAILDKADAIRRKRQQAIDLTDQLLRSVFLDMFGDPVANPKGWEVRNLKHISIKIHSGSTPKGGSKVYVKEGIVFFRSQNVWKNNLVLDDIAYIDKATHSKMSKSSLKKKDLLMTKTGRFNTENSSLGRAAMYLGEDDSANINGHVYLIRLQNDIVKEFVLHILTSTEYRDYIRSVCVGGIDKRQINKEHLEQFPIIYPPIDMQKQFAVLLQTVEVKKKQEIKSLKKSEELFSSLIQQAFNSELSKQVKAA